MGSAERSTGAVKQHQLTLGVRFRTGVTTTLTLPRPLNTPQLRATCPDRRQQIATLLDEYADAQVAHALTQRGLRIGAGASVDSISVQWVRFAAKLPSLKERLLAQGMLTSAQLTERLGVERSTISRWRTQGLIEARICDDSGQWLYWRPTQIPPPRRSGSRK
jgi:hypothetical protein